LIPGDITGDNIVNIADYDVSEAYWLQTNAPQADISGDGVVNVHEYNMMRANWFDTGHPE
jgi:hypothetical protein